MRRAKTVPYWDRFCINSAICILPCQDTSHWDELSSRFVKNLPRLTLVRTTQEQLVLKRAGPRRDAEGGLSLHPLSAPAQKIRKATDSRKSPSIPFFEVVYKWKSWTKWVRKTKPYILPWRQNKNDGLAWQTRNAGSRPFLESLMSLSSRPLRP